MKSHHRRAERWKKEREEYEKVHGVPRPEPVPYPLRYAGQVFYALDLLGSALTGGHARETISSRIGRFKEQHGGSMLWEANPIRLLSGILHLIDADHVEEAWLAHRKRLEWERLNSKDM